MEKSNNGAAKAEMFTSTTARQGLSSVLVPRVQERGVPTGACAEQGCWAEQGNRELISGKKTETAGLVYPKHRPKGDQVAL